MGGYFLVAARHDLVALFRATVAGRVVAGTGLIVIVSLWEYWPAVALGVVDIGGALWTWFALRRADQDRPAGERVDQR